MMRRAVAALCWSLLALFVGGPMAYVAVYAARDAGPGALWTLATNAEALSALALTTLTSAGAAIFALAVGYPLAVAVETLQIRGARALRIALSLPTAVPPYIWAMGWIALASPNSGMLNQLLGRGTVNVYGVAGMTLVLGTTGVPLVTVATMAALRNIDGALLEAARICGASPIRAIWISAGQLSLPAALGGAALVFLSSASSFGVPYLLGVPAQPPALTLTSRIYSEMLLSKNGLASAVALSAILLVAATVVLALAEYLSRIGRASLSLGKGARRLAMAAGRTSTIATAAAWATVAVLYLAPLGAILLLSLQQIPGRFDSLGLAHWGGALHNHRTIAAALRSAGLALAAGASVVGLGLSVAIVAGRKVQGRALEWLANWPYAIPGTVYAVALIAAFSAPLRMVVADTFAVTLLLANSLWLVFVAYVFKHLAFGVRNSKAALLQTDQSLIEATRIFGASPTRSFWDGLFPQLRAPLAAAFLLTALTCATELTLSVLLVPSGRDVLGTLIFEMQSYADPSGAAVIACAVILIAGVSMTLITRREQTT